MAGRFRAWTIVLALLVVGLGWSVPAWADPKDDARRYFLAGLDAARAGLYQEALQSFLSAQNAYPHPTTLYNIGRSYADLGDLENALLYYRQYRDAAPEKAADVDPIIAALEAKLRQQQVDALSEIAPAPVPAAPAPAATAEDVARLQAIADELAALSAQMQARSVAAADATQPAQPASAPQDHSAPTGTSAQEATASPVDGALVAGGDLLDDAYERVVVTASRYGQSPLDSPSTVTILTSEDIRLSGAATLGDVLRRVAGVDVMTLSASQPDISIRGFNRELSNKVLVLIDGRSVYLDMLGTVLWETLPIALEEIDRIEVVRGPGSAIYGANAMTGVINIITRVPGTGDSMVHVEGGTSGTLRGDVIASGRQGPTGWRLSSGYHELGRWEGTADPSAHSSLRPFETDDATASKVLRVNGRVDRKLGKDGFASVSAGHTQGVTEYYVFGALGDQVTDFDHSYVRSDLGLGPFHLWGFFNRWAGPTGPWLEYQGQRSLWTEYDNRTLDLELESDMAFSTGSVDHRLNAGVGYRGKSVSWAYLEGGGDPIHENHFNAFVQDAAQLGIVKLIGSLRVDRHPLVDIAKTISPRGAAIVRVAKQTSLRANVGTSFRSPSFMESYLQLAQPTNADGIYIDTLGNKNLAPERIFTGEVGIHDASSRFHEADAAAYVNRVTELIYVSDVIPQITPYDPANNGFSAGSTTFENLPQVYTAYGAEIEGRLFPADGLDVYANGALERIMEETDGVAVRDGSTSLLKINAGVMYRSPWRVDLGAHFSGLSSQVWRMREFDEAGQLIVQEAALPARVIGAVELAGRPLADGKLELSLSAWNIGPLITGQAFREHPKGQEVGSRVFGGATWRY
ncbi:MAG: TonB-dependent receptor [Oligoflexia bacterium]|nr:TonB-dependent receptor [Oligoflexia bacterium]